MNVLVTGGAGYIGSLAVNELINKGVQVIVVDNLSRGSILAINKKAIFYKIDIKDYYALSMVFTEHKIDVVLHFAAKMIAPESVEKPLEYYENNVYGTNVLLKVMKDNNVNNIVFSSTAAVYGLLDKGNDVIYENDITEPINPYGETKLATEKMIKWASNAYGLNYIIFRYFNVAGGKKIGLDPINQTALIPRLILTANGYFDKFYIYGDDYNTKDGTCIRDYIHIEDLVTAHIIACEKLYHKSHQNGIYNLGNGRGFTVLEVYEKAKIITKKDIPMEIVDRRNGDPVISVASSKKAKELLNWIPKHSNIEDIIKSSLNNM